MPLLLSVTDGRAQCRTQLVAAGIAHGEPCVLFDDEQMIKPGLVHAAAHIAVSLHVRLTGVSDERQDAFQRLGVNVT